MTNYEKYGKKYYEKNKEQELKRGKEYYAKNKERKRGLYLERRSSILKSRYGITEEDYQEMLTAQNGQCKICGTTSPGGKGRVFHVDHCHKTLEVRGLLCSSCNHGLGSFKDNPDLLLKGAAYLKGDL